MKYGELFYLQNLEGGWVGLPASTFIILDEKGFVKTNEFQKPLFVKLGDVVTIKDHRTGRIIFRGPLLDEDRVTIPRPPANKNLLEVYGTFNFIRYL